jgi:hypothetical protein
MTQIKLTESQRLLLSEMRVRKMKLVNHQGLTWFGWIGNNGNIPFVTAKALQKKGIFTIGSDGVCQLTELGLTIKL